MTGPQRPGAPSPGRASAKQVRGLEVIGGQSIHRVTAAAFAAARPRDLARRRASGTGGLSRLRGNAGAMSTAVDENQAGGHALLR
jgi:hypothetical protein